MPQHEVANGNGHKELARAKPTTSSNLVAKKPCPSKPSGLYVGLISTGIVVELIFFVFSNFSKQHAIF
jgi:hypothetical protein